MRNIQDIFRYASHAELGFIIFDRLQKYDLLFEWKDYSGNLFDRLQFI